MNAKGLFGALCSTRGRIGYVPIEDKALELHLPYSGACGILHKLPTACPDTPYSETIALLPCMGHEMKTDQRVKFRDVSGDVGLNKASERRRLGEQKRRDLVLPSGPKASNMI